MKIKQKSDIESNRRIWMPQDFFDNKEANNCNIGRISSDSANFQQHVLPSFLVSLNRTDCRIYDFQGGGGVGAQAQMVHVMHAFASHPLLLRPDRLELLM